MRTEGQAEGQTNMKKLKVDFRSFSNASKTLRLYFTFSLYVSYHSHLKPLAFPYM